MQPGPFVRAICRIRGCMELSSAKPLLADLKIAKDRSQNARCWFVPLG
jgi:hypothetical protein